MSNLYYTYDMCTVFIGTSVGSVTVELSGVTDTVAIVTGLTPGASYIFSVTAENAVSSQDTDINDRTTYIVATTDEKGDHNMMVYINYESIRKMYCHYSIIHILLAIHFYSLWSLHNSYFLNSLYLFWV